MPTLVLLHTPGRLVQTLHLRDVLRQRYPGLEVTARTAKVPGAVVLHKAGNQRDQDEARQLASALTARFGVAKDPRADRFLVDRVAVLSDCRLCRERDAQASGMEVLL